MNTILCKLKINSFIALNNSIDYDSIELFLFSNSTLISLTPRSKSY